MTETPRFLTVDEERRATEAALRAFDTSILLQKGQLGAHETSMRDLQALGYPTDKISPPLGFDERSVKAHRELIAGIIQDAAVSGLKGSENYLERQAKLGELELPPPLPEGTPHGYVRGELPAPPPPVPQAALAKLRFPFSEALTQGFASVNVELPGQSVQRKR